MPTLLLALLLLALPASGATIYTDRAAWEADAGAFLAESFDRPDAPVPSAPGQVNHLYLGPVRFAVPVPEDRRVGVYDDALHGNLLSYDRNEFDESSDRTWNSLFFENYPLTGFAFDLLSLSAGDTLLHVQLLGAQEIAADLAPGFFGVLGVNFHTLVFSLRAPGEREAYYALDSLAYVPLAGVPEPGTGLLVALGMGWMAGRRRGLA